MTVIVKTPLMADKICALLDGETIDGMTFAFVGKQGMEMTFSVTDDEGKDAVAVAKNVIKASSFGKGIFFSVVAG